MTPKRPRDPNQLAKSIIDIATAEKQEVDHAAGKGRKVDHSTMTPKIAPHPTSGKAAKKAGPSRP